MACQRLVSPRRIIVSAGFFLLMGLFAMPAMALDRYMNHGEGTVTDTKTAMWAASGNKLERHCQKYSGGGHGGCRRYLNSRASMILKKKTRGYHVTIFIDTFPVAGLQRPVALWLPDLISPTVPYTGSASHTPAPHGSCRCEVHSPIDQCLPFLIPSHALFASFTYRLTICN
jgi:hypothetical protein